MTKTSTNSANARHETRDSVKEIVESYRAESPLAEASTIPAPWYVDPRVLQLERRTVFSRSWQLAGRVDQVRRAGEYLTCDIAGEPVLVVRGNDGVLRGFFNVCRHHAAIVMPRSEGKTQNLRCPYHGWTYTLKGELKGTPDFAGVCNFDRAMTGLVPVQVDVWEKWVFVKLEAVGSSLAEFLSGALMNPIRRLGLEKLHWLERRRYSLNCNWKIFVDNYLDGGYHVPLLHRGLSSVLDRSQYTIETGERFCLQSSPITKRGGDVRMSAVRKGNRARYYWIYPNLMVNAYRGVLDTNLVCPSGVDRTEIIFDFYFADISERARERDLASIAASERIQEEDAAICSSVQRGLASPAYVAGRLSVRREAGEHLFHRLLYSDLKTGLDGALGR
ncbi:MAG TPA: aromatic ring-hydroxylating dioxygenase subunit alpha [Candidatus Binatia bacterium]|nr:aromatic ring-hydroxylating dioxygenase subunit alpha [Candidatus Binatia bacterium]